MHLYMAGGENGGETHNIQLETKVPYSLASFYSGGASGRRRALEIAVQPWCKDFMLDSGAFSFRQQKEQVPDKKWEEYINDYINFINVNHIRHFIEMDIDTVCGYERVKEIRAYIERHTGKQCIPAWHRSRGIDDYIGMCRDYGYVAIGGIVEAKKKGPKALQEFEEVFPLLIDIAHNYGAKVHGLGYTNLNRLHRFGFDSVDSASWIIGGGRGRIYYVKNDGRITSDKAGKRMNTYDIQRHNCIFFANLAREYDKKGVKRQ